MLLPPPGAAAGLHLPSREPFRSKTSLSALFKPSLEARMRERCKEGVGVLFAQAKPQPLWVRLVLKGVNEFQMPARRTDGRKWASTTALRPSVRFVRDTVTSRR